RRIAWLNASNDDPARLRSCRQHRNRAQRTAAASFDLDRQRIQRPPTWWQLIESGEVLERRDVALVEDLMRLEQRRLPVVDAGRIETDGFHLARLGEPFCGVGMQAWQMKL